MAFTPAFQDFEQDCPKCKGRARIDHENGTCTLCTQCHGTGLVLTEKGIAYKQFHKRVLNIIKREAIAPDAPF